MIKVNDEINVKIEKLSSEGTGIARYDGIVIFVEQACPDDELKIKIISVKKTYATGKIIEIIKPSAHRVEPFCKMQKVCGACQIQFINYDYQLKIKKQIVEDAMHNIGGIDTCVGNTIPSPETMCYRYKIQYPISSTKVSKRLLAGYYKQKTHEVLNIKHCPIQPEIVDKIMEFIRENALKLNISGYNELKHKGDLRHVVVRSSLATGKNLVVLVVNSPKPFQKIIDIANLIYSNFKEVSGVCLNYNSKKTNVILSNNTELIVGKDFVKERILDKTFRIGANTFFQVNPKSAENIFKYVKDYIKNNFEHATVFDAYAGVTTFGIVVSDVCKKVVSVEECKEAVKLADEVLKLNDIKNVELHNMDAELFFEKELKTKKRRFDITILDPPRKGSTEKTLDNILQLTKNKIIYVSCNPATLARDLKYLVSKGCTVESLQPFDMFCHTNHVETVAIISLNN